MKKTAATFLMLLFVISAVFSFSACSDKNAPITSNWELESITNGKTFSRASDFEDKDKPRFICDKELDVTFYNLGDIHYGRIESQKDDLYIISYNDTDTRMFAKVIKEELHITIEGNNDLEMVFKTTKDQTLIPVIDKENDNSDIKAIMVSNCSVEFTNNSDKVWCFGEYYQLEVMKDSKWYYAPSSEPVSVHDLGHELQPGQSTTLTYDLTPYGELKPANYRLACGDIGDGSNYCYAYFTIEIDGAFTAYVY